MSLDKSQKDWGWIKAKDFMLFNPKESIKKGTVVKNVPMDKIEPKTKEIPSYELTEYKGGVKFRNGDILMARITPCLENGKISQVSILDYNEIGAGSTEFIVLREKEGISDKDFIYYLSNSEYFKEPAIKSMVGSSGRQRVQRDVVENLEIYVPSLNTQKKIGRLLSLFDKKISLNKKINKNLLQVSKVIFKNWFVDFKPFDGVQPNNWKISTLEEVCNLNAGGDKPDVVSDEITDDCIYPIYSNGLDNNGLYGYTNHAKIFEESVTVSARGTIGFVCLRHVPYVPIVRLVSVIPNKEFISAKYLYLFLDRLNILGTGTTQQQLTIPDFKKTEILIPSIDIVESFTNHINPLFEKIWAQEEEIKKLSKLRDTLLPKLMFGEIDVSEINCDLE